MKSKLNSLVFANVVMLGILFSASTFADSQDCSDEKNDAIKSCLGRYGTTDASMPDAGGSARIFSGGTTEAGGADQVAAKIKDASQKCEQIDQKACLDACSVALNKAPYLKNEINQNAQKCVDGIGALQARGDQSIAHLNSVAQQSRDVSSAACVGDSCKAAVQKVGTWTGRGPGTGINGENSPHIITIETTNKGARTIFMDDADSGQNISVTHIPVQ